MGSNQITRSNPWRFLQHYQLWSSLEHEAILFSFNLFSLIIFFYFISETKHVSIKDPPLSGGGRATSQCTENNKELWVWQKPQSIMVPQMLVLVRRKNSDTFGEEQQWKVTVLNIYFSVLVVKCSYASSHCPASVVCQSGLCFHFLTLHAPVLPWPALSVPLPSEELFV